MRAAAGSPAAAAILRARAQALARRDEVAPTGASLELLEFRLAGNRFAVETRHVSHVVPLEDLTPVPCTPPFVAGVVNVRGRITAVIDIQLFLDLPVRGLTDLHHIILVHGPNLEFGLLADVIVGVRDQPLDTLQPAALPQAGGRVDYLRGVTAERLGVLDLERMLADPRIIVNEEVSP